jgi:short-subunit dehydrogenase
MNIADSVAVVTGASAGLGLSVSRQLTDRGATVYGLARRKERLRTAEVDLGSSFRGVLCDVSDETQVREAFSRIEREQRRIDILINNAGFGRFGPIDALESQDWEALFHTNVRGVFLCSREVIPIMKRQGADGDLGGHIVNVASVAGLIGNANLGAYNATKFAVRGLSESMMKELRDDGIKVTCLYPGSIATEFFDAAGIDMSSRPMTAEEVASTVIHVLDTPDNYLISEVAMRPLKPRR